MSSIYIPSQVFAQSNSIKIIATTGMQATGTPVGNFFSRFDLPVINNAGKIAFLAKVQDKNKSSGEDGNFYSSVWIKEENRPLSILVREGSPAREVSNNTFFSNHPRMDDGFTTNRRFRGGRTSNIFLNERGEVAFNFRLEKRNSPENSFYSVWVGSTQNDLTPVLFHEMDNPEGGTFNTLSPDSIIPFYLNDNGQVVFKYPEDSSIDRLWLADPACRDEETLVPLLDWNICTFCFVGFFYFDNDGSVGLFGSTDALTGFTEINCRGLWSAEPGLLSQVILWNDSCPGMNKGDVELNNSFNAVNGRPGFFFNNNGSALLYGLVPSTGVESLYVYDKAGNRRLVAGDNGIDVLDHTNDNANLFLLDDGRALFSRINESTKKTSLWLEDELIVREGDKAPDSATNERFLDIWISTLANNRGQVVFRATLTEGELDGFGNEAVSSSGIYAYDGSKIVKILQTGDQLDIGNGNKQTISELLIHRNQNGTNPKAFNDQGKLVFYVSSETGIESIVTAQMEVPITSDSCTTSTNTLTAANFAQSTTALGFVNTFTGEIVLNEPVDIFLNGPMPISFIRYYASALDRGNIDVLGRNWKHNFQWEFTRLKDDVEIITHTGRIIRFKKNNVDIKWDLIEPLDIKYQLTENGDQFIFADISTELQFTFEFEDCRKAKLTFIEDGRGNKLTLKYSNNDLLEQVSNDSGLKLTLDYDIDDHLTKVSDGTREVKYTYKNNLLSTFTNTLEKTTAYKYDELNNICGLLSEITLPNGNTPVTISYNDDGNVSVVEDKAENVYSFDYSDSVTTVFTPINQSGIGNSRQYLYGENGELLSFTDESDNSITFRYDDNNRRTSVTNRLNNTTFYTYDDESGKISSITEPDNSTTEFIYTKRSTNGIDFFDLTKLLYPDSTSESNVYDDSGNITSRIDRNNKEWTYTYNNNGRIETFKNPLGGTITFNYNENGIPSSVNDGKGTTSFEHDNLNRITTIKHPDETTRVYTYDNNDFVVSVKDESENTATYTYNDNSNLASITDPLQNKVEYKYDSMERLNSIIEENIGTSEATYNEIWRSKEIKDQANNSIAFEYSETGIVTNVTDTLGFKWKADYNNEGVIKSATDPLDNTTTFTSDSMDRITEIKTPLDNTLQTEYDEMGRVKKIKNPLNQEAKIDYDKLGLVSKIQFPSNAEIVYERNDLGLVTKTVDPNKNEWIRKYDEFGRLTETSDPIGSIEKYEYDNRSRLSKVTYPDNGTADITYDGTNNITRLKYTEGDAGPIIEARFSDQISDRPKTLQGDQGPRVITLDYERDNRGQITNAEGVSLTIKNKQIVESNGIKITYDEKSRIETITYPSVDDIGAKARTVTYKYKGRALEEIVDWDSKTTTFNYRSDGRLANITRPNGFTTKYNTYTNPNDSTYISKNEAKFIPTLEKGMKIEEIEEDFPENLEGTAILTSKHAVLIGKTGKILDAVQGGVQSTLISDKSNLSLVYNQGSQIKAFQYDKRGRLTFDNNYMYSWDPASRIETIQNTTSASKLVKDTYLYDALGLRIERKTTIGDNVSITKYVWNYALKTPRVSQIVHTSNGKTIVWSYVYTPSGILLFAVRANDNKKVYFHYDFKGNTAFLSGDKGNIVEEYDYTLNGEQAETREGTDEDFDGFEFPNIFTYRAMLGFMNDVVREGDNDDLHNLYCDGAGFINSKYNRFIERTNWHRFDLAAAPEINYHNSPFFDGAILAATGFLMVVIPEPTTSVAGVAQILYAADMMYAGTKQVVTNKHQDTILHKTLRTGAETFITDDKFYAELIATGGEILIPGGIATIGNRSRALTQRLNALTQRRSPGLALATEAKKVEAGLSSIGKERIIVLQDQNVSSYKNWLLHGKSQFPKGRPDLEARAATELGGKTPTINFTKELLEVIPNGHGIDFAIRPNGSIFVGTKHWYLAGSKALANGRSFGGARLITGGEMMRKGDTIIFNLQSGTYRAYAQPGREKIVKWLLKRNGFKDAVFAPKLKIVK